MGCAQTLTYDAEGRLTSVSGLAGSEGFTYDGDGALVKRSTTGPTNPPTSYNEGFTGYNGGWTYSVSCPGCPIDQQVNQPGGTGHPSILTNPANKEVYRTANVSDGQVVRVAFGVGSTTSGASIGLETGDWAAGTYHRFGVWQRDGQLVLHLFRNSQQLEQVVLMPSIEANVWYILELAVDDGAGFRASVWKASEAGTRTEMRYEMPRTSGWRFHVWSGSALTSLDDYSEGSVGTTTSATRIVGKHYEETPSASVRVKRYYANGALLATRQTYYGSVPGTEVTYVQGDHLGSTSTLTNWAGAVVGRERYSAFGERRRSDSAAITDQLYTGQRLNVLSGLYHYSDGTSAGRFYDPLLARFVQADPVTPPGSVGLNHYAYANNSPVRYNDPSGHWTDEQLSGALGDDWREDYFGEGAVFAGRDKMLEFLTSPNTTSPVVLGAMTPLMLAARAAQAAGLPMQDVDAIGARVVFSGSGGAYGEGAADAILNFTSGEFSVFGTLGVGGVLGVGAQLVGGPFWVMNLPSNDDYRRVFMAGGVAAGDGLGVNGELFWTSPMADTFNAWDKTHGAYLVVRYT